MKHDVVKQAANDMALKEVDKFFFDQRIFLEVVTISDEEGEIDILARSGTWPGDVCAPRIFVKATCSPFPTRTGNLGEEKKTTCTPR